MRYEKEIREWLNDPERIRSAKAYAVAPEPGGRLSEQDIQDVLAVLSWPENAGYLKNTDSARIGASVIRGRLLCVAKIPTKGGTNEGNL